MVTGALHHVEVWSHDLAVSEPAWAWLLVRLGWVEDSRWATGVSWRQGDVYLVLEQGPDVLDERHRRRAPGVNHLAFHGGARADVDALVAAAGEHGWSLLFADRHPYAGGPQHYAAYLEDALGYEVEIVAAAAAADR